MSPGPRTGLGDTFYLHQPNMKQLDPNRLCLARPSSRKTEYASLGSYLYLLGCNITRHYPEITTCLYEVHESRIVLMRNMIVAEAKKQGCGKIYMIDPDARLDFYVRRNPDGSYANRFRPFFDLAWAFMREHREDIGPCVLGVPARGCSPQNEVQVFRRAPGDSLTKIPNEEAKHLTGWYRVGAVGTHAMLIDTNVFSRLEHPYFEDVYRDNTHTQLWRGQDVTFCRKCTLVDIPVLVNFDCWSDHWQDECVRMPGAEDAPVHDIPKEWSSPPQSQPAPNDTEPKYTVLE